MERTWQNGTIETEIGYDSKGYFVEWFNIKTEKVVRWYGGLAGCAERAKFPPPRKGWVDLREERPVDAATATGMYDR